MSIMCDVTTCKYNTGGSCDRVDIYISDAETGWKQSQRRSESERDWIKT